LANIIAGALRVKALSIRSGGKRSNSLLDMCASLEWEILVFRTCKGYSA
jgi:hypothetical protein